MHNGLSSGEISSELLSILLIDRTTGENIVWGTTDYCEYSCFAVEEIQLDKVELIRSRYEKISKLVIEQKFLRRLGYAMSKII